MACWVGFGCATAAALAGLYMFSASPLAAFQPASQEESFHLKLRTEVRPFRVEDVWEAAYFEGKFDARQTAIVICDMWDRHWCSGATRRVGLIAHKMEPVLEAARAAGITIIHAPSDTMAYYKDYPQRLNILAVPRASAPAPLGLDSPPLPIDDSDGGCDTPGDKSHRAWTSEISTLKIAPQDFISDNGNEIYDLLKQRNVKSLLIMGVHANMCILNRTFGIKRMTNWGIRCVLVRDLTDAMYDSNSRPYVSHEEGTRLVIQYIEKYWCPTTESSELLKALQR